MNALFLPLVSKQPPTKQPNTTIITKQIQELVEAIVLPIQHKDRFEKLGIRPPKGVLLYGPPGAFCAMMIECLCVCARGVVPSTTPFNTPHKNNEPKKHPKKKGTGKTLIARACAAQTNATFLKLAGPQLVQMFIGDGAKMVRDAFALAKEKAPAIIFIDEIDAIGTKRFDSELSGDREVQRTMLELLNQLDGFTSSDAVKVRGAGVCVCVCARVCGWLVGCCWLLVVVVAGGGCWWWRGGCWWWLLLARRPVLRAFCTLRPHSIITFPTPSNSRVTPHDHPQTKHPNQKRTQTKKKIIAATNRPDILDPALMRSGRLDRKVEFPHPNEDARAKVRCWRLLLLLVVVLCWWQDVVVGVRPPFPKHPQPPPTNPQTTQKQNKQHKQTKKQTKPKIKPPLYT